jgi:hypothetical protein
MMRPRRMSFAKSVCMKPLLTLGAFLLVSLLQAGCNTVADTRAEQDNHRQGVAVQGRPERSSGDVGQPR